MQDFFLHYHIRHLSFILRKSERFIKIYHMCLQIHLMNGRGFRTRGDLF